MTAPDIVQALAAVMTDVTHVGKTDRNDFHWFLFRGIDSVLNEVGPALRQHHVLALPELRDLQSRDVSVADKGKVAREITLTVAYHFYGPAGDHLTVVVPGEAQDVGDKAVSKAMSVAHRIALIQALSIPTRGRDPDSSTYLRDDPLREVKSKIMEAAKRKGWNVDQLAADYTGFSQGGDIREADEQALTEYLAYLQPPQKMRRRTVPAEESGGGHG